MFQNNLAVNLGKLPDPPSLFAKEIFIPSQNWSFLSFSEQIALNGNIAV